MLRISHRRCVLTLLKDYTSNFKPNWLSTGTTPTKYLSSNKSRCFNRSTLGAVYFRKQMSRSLFLNVQANQLIRRRKRIEPMLSILFCIISLVSRLLSRNILWFCVAFNLHCKQGQFRTLLLKWRIKGRKRAEGKSSSFLQQGILNKDHWT